MMRKVKAGFGKFEDKNKWDVYKNCPVKINFNGASYCGIVKEANYIRDYVYLQPAVVTNASGTKLGIVDKPLMLPFEGPVVAPLMENSLEEFVEEWNKKNSKDTKK